jgi:hypothetical protein
MPESLKTALSKGLAYLEKISLNLYDRKPRCGYHLFFVFWKIPGSIFGPKASYHD